MSSTLDQRSAKTQDPAVSQTQATNVEYTYTHGMPVQGGYPTPAMAPGGGPEAAYAMYGGQYEPYMQFPGGMMPDAGGVWSTDPAAYAGYGGGPADYVQYSDGTGEQYPGYDYSGFGWFPAGVDYGTAWGPNVPVQHQQQQQGGKARVFDSYVNGYYGVVDNSMRSNGSAAAYGQMNGMHSLDQSMRGMQLSDDKGDIAEMGEHASNQSAAAQQKKSWANIASAPAKTVLPRPAKPQGSQLPRGVLAVSASMRQESGGSGRVIERDEQLAENSGGPAASSIPAGQYNPKEFDVNTKDARYFVIKSFSEDDIHRSIKFSIWCSTEYGNKRLDAAFHEREGKGPVYLLYSVNGSGHFCGVAEMLSPVDYSTSSKVWAQDKWKGSFGVKWIFVKDVPNSQLRHIRLENNEGKPVTNSRDTQEVIGEKGRQVLRIIHQYRHTTSIFDDFGHYEKQLEENSATVGSGDESAPSAASK